MAIARMRTIVLDCPDPAELAEFYRQLVGGEVTATSDDWGRGVCACHSESGWRLPSGMIKTRRTRSGSGARMARWLATVGRCLAAGLASTLTLPTDF